MSAARDNEKIKLFVKNALGCGCPENVFEKIDVSKLLVENEKEITRIVVGDTLLIYVMQPDPSGDLVDSVEAIGLAGKIDRDTNSYNRFRLVVSGFGDGLQQQKAAERFSKLFDTDDRLHIHFVKQEQVEGLD